LGVELDVFVSGGTVPSEVVGVVVRDEATVANVTVSVGVAARAVVMEFRATVETRGLTVSNALGKGSWVLLLMVPRVREPIDRVSGVEGKSLGKCELPGCVLTERHGGADRNLIVKIGVKTGAGLSCREARATWPHLFLPLIPVPRQLPLPLDQGSFPGREVTVLVYVGKNSWVFEGAEGDVY